MRPPYLFEEKVSYLIDTPEDRLPCFSLLERVTIIALKAMWKGKLETEGSCACNSDDRTGGDDRGREHTAFGLLQLQPDRLPQQHEYSFQPQKGAHRGF